MLGMFLITALHDVLVTALGPYNLGAWRGLFELRGATQEPYRGVRNNPAGRGGGPSLGFVCGLLDARGMYGYYGTV